MISTSYLSLISGTISNSRYNALVLFVINCGPCGLFSQKLIVVYFLENLIFRDWRAVTLGGSCCSSVIPCR